MTADAIYRVLKDGTPAERQDLVRTLPPDPMKEMALSLIDSARPGMVVVALGPATIGYCNGGAPEVGVELARALHRYALELFQGTPDHGLLPTTLSGLAHSFVQASNLLGRSAEALAFADRWMPFYEELGETENLPALKAGRVQALLNLNRIDEAAEGLEDPMIDGNPATAIEVARLRRRIAQLRTTITTDRSGAAEAPDSAGADFVALAQAALKTVARELPDGAKMNALIDKLSEAPRLDPNDPAGFARLAELLKQGEGLLTRGSAEESELTVRRRIREATGIFAVEKQPAPERIRASLTALEPALDWARAHNHMELQNDALYGIYLCRSRLKAPSAAADALLVVRRNLEAARAGITDVVKRGGAFSQYPHLFAALCEKLHAAGRFGEMLETIEASKGRGVADLLTIRGGSAVPDASIYSAVARLPALCRTWGFHYVTYFVDDEVTYAVLVTSDGRIHAPPPVPLSRAALRAAASPMDPEAADRLAPLVAWLEPFLDNGTITVGAHLSIAPDDDLANVPFAFLPFKGRPLAESVSTSRIHNAFHLAHLLDAKAERPAKYLGVVVATRQNVEGDKWKGMHASLLKPIDYLAGAMAGETLEGAAVSPAALEAQELSGRIVHFSTHGLFPDSGAPFDHSGLLLADGASLPDGKEVEMATVLTPRRIFDADLDLAGSHVSMMACVSGLSREGAGGDALGMEWAMVQAGASSVLSTHWNVSAKLASAFLTAFYHAWLGGNKSRAEALSATIASLKAAGGRGGETASWAAFSLTGDWR